MLLACFKKEEAVENANKTIVALRDVSDFIAEHDLPLPTSIEFTSYDEAVRIFFYYDTLKEDVLQWLRALGQFDKNYSYEYTRFRGQIESTPVELTFSRETVCARKQVGTRAETREVPVTTRTETVQVPIYEWDCEPVLAKSVVQSS